MILPELTTSADDCVRGNTELDAYVCAIIVTYGPRHHFLVQVIDRVASCGVGHIIVVFNGNYKGDISVPENCTLLKQPTNLGSAGGFKAGLQAALRLDAEFFFLLDDDNLPAKECIQRLLSAHQELGGSSLVSLQAFRRSQPWQCIAVCEGFAPVGQPNTYGWFNFVNERYLLRRQLAPKSTNRQCQSPKRGNKFVRISVAAYGGYFVHREALLFSELPDPRYFCYYDDLDFTDRLVRRGVTIHICTDAVIDDLDTSWHARDERVHPAMSPQTPDERVYLDLRNAFIFYRSRIGSRTLYCINGVGFWLGIAYLALFRSADLRTTRRRIALICRAVWHGSRGDFVPYARSDLDQQDSRR
jgi:GT2 family glycosyltransferase